MAIDGILLTGATVLYQSTSGALRVGQVVATGSLGTLAIHGPEGVEQGVEVIEPGDERAAPIAHLVFKCEWFEQGIPVGPVEVMLRSEVGKLRLKNFGDLVGAEPPVWLSWRQVAALAAAHGVELQDH